MDFADYQQQAVKTSQLDLKIPTDAVAATFGLTHVAGRIANVYKLHLRDSIDPGNYKNSLQIALGDLLWYTAAVATAFGLELESIAENNLTRTRDRYLAPGSDEVVPPLDKGFPAVERFPRRLVFHFRDVDAETAELHLVDAEPNLFPNGPTVNVGKPAGFTVGRQLGDRLTDNSRRRDGYRFHDAIHLSFMAVLGWSPIMRRLLQLKRRSQPQIDENEDGARAAFAEEGLAHALTGMAKTRQMFRDNVTVDGDVLNLVAAVTRDLEVSRRPLSLWVRAIVQAFDALQKLDENSGGYLTADLDGRELAFSKIHYDGGSSGDDH